MVCKKKIVVPDCEGMSSEEWCETLKILESLPVYYEIWETEECEY